MHLFSKIFLIVLFVVPSCFAYGQTNLIDSLTQEIETQDTEIKRLTTLNDVIPELVNLDLEKTISYAQESLLLAKKLKNKEEEVKSLYNLGKVTYDTKNRNSSLQYFLEAEKLANEIDLPKIHAYIFMSIARYHRYVSKDSTKTVDHFKKSLEVSEANNLDYEIARSNAKLASFYTKYNEIELCEQYLEKAAYHYTKLKNGAKTVAHYYNEVGDKIWDTNPKKSMDLYIKGNEYSSTPTLMASLAKAYSFIGDYDTALSYLEQAIPYFRKSEKNSRMLGVCIAQLAEVYLHLGKIEDAYKTCNEGIQLLSPLGISDQRGIPALLRIKGIIAEKEGDNQLAIDYFNQSQTEAKRIKFGFQRVKSQLTTGIFYYNKGELNESRILCNRSYDDSRKHGFTNLEVESCNCLVEVFKDLEDFSQALKFYERKVALSDSLSTLKVKHALDVNSKIILKDKELAEQIYQNQLREKEFTILLITLFLGLLIIGFLAYSYRKIRKQNKTIKQKTKELESVNNSLEISNVELERFAHIASHDLKSPLNNIISFTELLDNNLQEDRTPIINDSLKFIRNSGKQMNLLIEDVLEYSKFSNEKVTKREVVNLNELLVEISKMIQFSDQYKSVEFKIEQLPIVNWNTAKLLLLFKNIIENGIKYNESETPLIKIYGIKDQNSYNIFIEDNGIGISDEYHETIFIMFKRLHRHEEFEGTGLGLATCKKIVEEFGGQISLQSKLEQGTTFKIEFPIELITD